MIIYFQLAVCIQVLLRTYLAENIAMRLLLILLASI